MDVQSGRIGEKACWFVGASYGGGTDDQTAYFLEQNIWINGYEDRYTELVNSIEVGDRIAIKSSYTRKRDLPFDARGHTVSTMAIKAIGTVTANPKDGRNLRVDWTPFDSPREWYFYTGRLTVWRVLPGDWKADALIAFAFEGADQDIDQFRNAPYWRERFGNLDDRETNFEWTQFYEAVADKLLEYRQRRPELIAAIGRMAERLEVLAYLREPVVGGGFRPLTDICPFTVMGAFNRGVTIDNRRAVASELAEFLGVLEPVPESFEGIPILNNQKSWFFGYKDVRESDDIGALWEAFSQALAYADATEANADTRDRFVSAYDDAAARHGVGWNLTMGLYWIRPWNYPTLDDQSRTYITSKLEMQIGRQGPKKRSSGEDYLAIVDRLEARFQQPDFPVHSFPELSLAAWNYKGPVGETDLPDDELVTLGTESEKRIVSYSIDNIVRDGSFLDREQLARILQRLNSKKNLILQGPPGTGKTWLARRLAFALIGERDDNRVRAVQFHPNLSYEDFIRGWRPMGDGKLELADGPFMEMIKQASNDPDARYVLVIEEINRGQPAQIFGEMLTLLEADKRNPGEALELSYRRHPDERVYIPGNLYVVGTMNIADRSLALVDLALRRRFAFIDLQPTFGRRWRDWVQASSGIDDSVLQDIEQRIGALNEQIAADAGLGPQFRIGHSYVTPVSGMRVGDPQAWFSQVVETEIRPLLEEYWFDSLDKAAAAQNRLLDGL